MTADQAQKTVFVKTYGCQMNVYDSERIVEQLAGEGYSQTEDAQSADLILLNTCHIREKAAEKVYSELGRIRQMVEAKPQTARQPVTPTRGLAVCGFASTIWRMRPSSE